MAGRIITGTVGLAVAAGAFVAPTSAQAAPKNSLFIHGTSKMASFASRAACNAHAQAEVRTVNANRNTKLVPELAEPGSLASGMRTTCYPLKSGKWSYLVAYYSKNGQPLMKSDKYVDIEQRFESDSPIDNEALLVRLHRVTKSASSMTMKQCNALANRDVATIKNTNSYRLLVGSSCGMAAGKISYQVIYGMAGQRAPIWRGDPQLAVGGPGDTDLAPMLDVLGYDYMSAWLGSGPSPAKAAQHAKAIAPLLKFARG